MAEGRAVELHKRKFIEILGAEDSEQNYAEKLREAITSKKFRFILNINELRSRESDLASRIIQEPREHMVALQEASTETARNLDPSFDKLLKTADLQVGFEGSLGTHAVTPRELNSSLLNTLVEVEGIVTKCSSVRPKLVRSVQYCPATNSYSVRDYRDSTSIDIGISMSSNAIGGANERLPTSSVLPTKDVNGNPLEVEHGLCLYKDYQTVILQEMPEKAKVGQLPRSVDVILEHDLVDHAKPGDRVLCIGVYRSLPSQYGGQTNGVFKTVLMCNNVKIIGKEIGAVRLTGNDVRNIREISQRTDVLETMSRALCPSIFGHEFIKKALILQLLGGCERNLENGTHLRGDINLMMVGDPSTAKSQLLRAVLDIAPLAISTTGRGSTGVGLTAAVTVDPETNERRLEAGAMVLADRGVVCIDEFDKMNEVDRVAIHEVMEQQTVTIAKAGIHASLNARSSVLAAANPIYGQYDKTRRPQENIGLPDSLLSRFDLLFIVLDQLDSSLDRTLSEHVIRSHQFRRPGTIMEPEALNVGSTLNLDDAQDSSIAADTPVWQRGGRALGGSSAAASASSSAHSNNNTSSSRGDLITKEFLRKYIHYAKNRIHPVLSDEAMDSISTAYANMRARQTKRNLPVTPRTLETMIRLASAAAKCRLSSCVEEQDVDTAMELLNFVMFHEIGDSSEAISQQQQQHQEPPLESNTRAFLDQNNENQQASSNLQAASLTNEIVEQADASQNSGAVATDDNSDAFKRVQRALGSCMEEEGDSIELSSLLQQLENSSSSQKGDTMKQSDVVAILHEMERTNKIMFMDDTIQMV